jgi:lysophospholipase L1-like esterase
MMNKNSIRRYLTYSTSDKPYTYDMNPVYKSETERFMRSDEKSDIVMFGNSITSQADWNELLGREDIVNRGISGDITEGMLKRIRSVLKVKPKYCFFMGGINDITRRVSYEKTLSNIQIISETLKTNGIIPVIQSVLYTESRFFSSDYNNPIVTKLNDDIMEFCSENGIDFIDLNRYMSENNSLRSEYTHDGLHLNAEGYAVWSRILTTYLKLNNK